MGMGSGDFDAAAKLIKILLACALFAAFFGGAAFALVMLKLFF